MQERCYFMFKPGFTDNETVQEVRKAVNEVGGQVIVEKKMRLSKKACREHYAHIVDLVNKETGERVYPKLEEYMLSGVVIGWLVVGNEGIIERLRKLMGSTKNPERGTLRERFSGRVPPEDRVTKNGFHCSDSIVSAEDEIDRFFNRAEQLDIEESRIR